MRRRLLIEALTVLVFLVVATGVIAVTGADLAVSSRFYIDGTWPVGDLFFWHLLYRLDRIPSFSLGIIGLGAFFMSYAKSGYYRWRRSGIFLLLLLILGPGLLVNTVFKEHWGRPRPREVIEFGGKKQFLHPWQKGEDGNGRSFPSGHSSAAFYMTAPYFIYRRSNKRLAKIWLLGGLIFGVLMSIARIAQGGHFLSDNLWAWGVVHLTALALCYCLGLDQADKTPPKTEIPTCST
jgi:membrane-associated PAP2 superfamily phosphatase